jgi:glycosyltransferase involved in cell wall biosynthesis
MNKSDLVLLVYGSLSKRKGIVTLIEALIDPSWPSTVSVLMAGTQDGFTKKLLSLPKAQRLKHDGRLIEMEGWLNDEQEARAFRSSDIVWLGYEGFFGMSGVLLQAGRMKLPIISCQEGLVGWMTKKYQLGLLLDPHDKKMIIDAVTELAENAQQRELFGLNGLGLAEGHTGEIFARAICDSIESAIR